MEYIDRKYYLQKLLETIGTPDIKVITGVRRSGKSFLLNMFRDYIIENFENINIISVDYNVPDYDDLRTYKALYKYVNNMYEPSKKNFVFIDEVQMCEEFERAIIGLHTNQRFDLYITGSNAFLSASDLATLFTGRTFEIMVYPFSLSEYMTYYKYTNPQESLTKYIEEGGMAGSYAYTSIESKYDYINRIFNTLIIRDIKEKFNIRNIQLFNKLVDFLLDNISNLTSSRSIASILKNTPDKIHHKTVTTYIDHLCNAFMFYQVKRYDIKGKNYLLGQSKFYTCDHAVRYARLGKKSLDTGRTLENIVAIELLRRGYNLFVGTIYDKEIDFVAIKRNKKFYFQVSNVINDESTLTREIEPLRKIDDAYPRYILARTNEPEIIQDGIHIVDVADWLIEKI